MTLKRSFSFVAALALASGGAAIAAPVEKAELDALRAQVQQLEQQLKVLSRQLEIKEEAAAAAPASPKITINDKGFTFASADGANAIKLRGLVQLDSRLFFGDDGLTNNAFVLRRARLIAEGTFLKNYSFQLVPDFGGTGTPTIQDANFTVALTPAAQLKFGKFKYPIGLELLQSDSWTFFNERSIVTNLVPNRDLGVQLGGELAGGRVSYAAGVFGGAPDGGSTNNADFDNEKDVAGRVAATPFKNAAGSPAQGLTVALAGSLGRAKTASGRTGGYRTDGQQTFFAYNGAVVADGQAWRVSPQVDYRNGSLGLIGEYVLSTVNLRPTATGAKSELRNRAWQIAAGWVLTGEDSSFNGVVPQTNFDWSAGTWGAFEVVARYGQLKIDDAAFPTFASAAANANRVESYGVGLNWYLSKVVRFTFDYYQDNFGFNSLAPAVPTTALLRQDEKALITRFQLSF